MTSPRTPEEWVQQIAAKRATRPKVDHNGRPVESNAAFWLYDHLGNIVALQGGASDE